jgi:hypothetical protein
MHFDHTSQHIGGHEARGPTTDDRDLGHRDRQV